MLKYLIGVSANEFFSSRLDSRTTGEGNAGELQLNTKQLILRDGGQVSVSTFGNGNAGNLIVNASESVKIIGIEPVGLFGLTTGIFAQAAESEGNGGSIEINTRSLVLTEGSEITTRTVGLGNAGNITLKVEDSINITGADTGIFADTEQGSTGDGGSIFIDPETIILQDGASIAVNSQGSGEGGNIQLQAGSLTLERSVITAETASNQGGNINLQLFDLLTLGNNSQISANAGRARTPQAEGDGGNIDIDAPFILSFPDENKITAEAFLGTGGNINITTNSIFGQEFLDISASSQFGLEGTVSINILELEPSPGLVELPSGLETLSIPQGCEASRGRGSSFISTGRGGLPPSPTETLSSHQVWRDVQLPTQLTKNSANTVKQNTTAERIVEASSWIINEEGIVELVAEESSNTHQGSCR
ncbi:MAG: S-layer family protein [Xenococcaceae cyanobacterium MO_167.B27]|nr:S-layer family protein [Xenococcaceae cyanobacterium MO_167.B27]